MSKLKIAGIIIAVMAASVFVFLYFVRPHGNKCNPGVVSRRRRGAWINDGFGSRRN